MLRKALLFHIFCILAISLNAQIDRTRTWYFGQQLGLEFKPNLTLLNTLNGSNYAFEGTGVWNSINGDLQFYADWQNLFGKNNDTINKDFHLGSNGSVSQATILTSIDDSFLYVITTNPNSFGSSNGPGGYTYSSYNIFKKKWFTKRTVLQRNSSECQTLVNHQNGKWQWVVSHSLLGDTLYSYLINENGLETCPTISHAGPFYPNSNPGQGVMKFSPDGKYLFFATWNLHFSVACSFNNQTGQIKELFRFKNFDYYPYGIEVDDNNLFVSMGRPRDIVYQYSLDKMDSTSVINSRKTLFDTTEFDKIGQIQMAPDGNMYVNEYEKNFLGKITKQSKDNYTFSFTPPLFGSKVGYGGFPNFNASYFHHAPLNFTYTHRCHSYTFNLKPKDTFKAHTFTWNISKGNKKETKTGKDLNYTFLDTGKWKVQLIASNGSRTDTIEKVMEVFKIVAQGFLGSDHFYSKGQKIGGILEAPANQHCSHWWRLGDSTETLGNTYSYNDTGTYIIKTTNKHFCNTWDTIQVRMCDSIPNAKLSRVRDTLFLSNSASTIYWYKNGQELLTNRNKQKLTLSTEGKYQTVLVNAQACADTSVIEDIQFLYAGVQSVHKSTIFIYPNPNKGEFTVNGLEANTSIKVVDALGKEIGFKKEKQTIKLNKPSAGVYYIVINGEAAKLFVE